MNRHILHAVNDLSDEAGGLTSAVLGLAAVHMQLGARVTIVSGRRKGASYQRATRFLTAAAGSADLRFCGSPNGVKAMIGSIVRNVLPTCDRVIVHSAWHVLGAVTAHLSATMNITYEVRPHGSLDPFDMQKHRHLKVLLGHTILRTAWRQVSAIVVTSERERLNLRGFGVAPIEVIPIPVASDDGVSVGGAGPAAGGRERYFLYLGRLHREKGLSLMLTAFEMLPDDVEVRLVVAGGAGDAATRRWLQQRWAGSSRRHQISLLPWQGEEDKWLLMRGALALVLLSDSENFGVVVAEAAAVKTPSVVTADVGLADEVENWRAGIVVDDAATASQAMLQLSLDENLRHDLGAGARQMYLHLCSPAAVAAKERARLADGLGENAD